MTHEEDATRQHSFDELARGLANGTVSRRRALKLLGGVLLGGALAAVPVLGGGSRGPSAFAQKKAEPGKGPPCPPGEHPCPDGTCVPLGTPCEAPGQEGGCTPPCASGETCCLGICCAPEQPCNSTPAGPICCPVGCFGAGGADGQPVCYRDPFPGDAYGICSLPSCNSAADCPAGEVCIQTPGCFFLDPSAGPNRCAPAC